MTKNFALALLLAMTTVAFSGCVGEAIKKEKAEAEEKRQAAMEQFEEKLKQDGGSSQPTASAPTSSESAAMAAEERGAWQEAFEGYLGALKELGEKAPRDADFRIRERLVKAARRLNPKPGISEEAQRRMDYGSTALKDATDESGLTAAIQEFKKASDEAPWWGPAYFNLGVVQEKAKRHGDALASFKLYLAASPDAADAPSVKHKINQLEYRQMQGPSQTLSGRWVVAAGDGGRGLGAYFDGISQDSTKYRWEGDGKRFKLIEQTPEGKESVLFDGTIEGSDLSGQFHYVPEIYSLCGTVFGGSLVRCYFPETYPFKGTVGKSGNKLFIKYSMPSISASGGLFNAPLNMNEDERNEYPLILTRESR